ncbi:hypothetical protein NPIL_255511 [Nephila pilipes]|uniref:Uncharacterized protein n=1 Tax=Nephila pilipes TaxID=299642 RepID=A0A8X6IYD9_NEPPI|nr:hypothetical protein NPIL_255511 [Nephila pilipes]
MGRGTGTADRCCYYVLQHVLRQTMHVERSRTHGGSRLHRLQAGRDFGRAESEEANHNVHTESAAFDLAIIHRSRTGAAIPLQAKRNR